MVVAANTLAVSPSDITLNTLKWFKFVPAD